MFDIESIQRKINLIREDLIKLESFKAAAFDELSKDWVKWNALEHIFMKIIGRGIDINEHIIVETAKPETESPRSYKETFLKLADLEVLPQSFAQKISKSAGFRNSIVHDYNKINREIIFSTVDEAVSEYADYCQYIFNFLEKWEKKHLQNSEEDIQK